MTEKNKEVEKVKLAISICSNRTMEPRCAISLAMVTHYLTAFSCPFAIISRLQASLLPTARQEVLREALEDGCTHQLWMDDDIEVNGDAVLRLLHAMKQNPDADVVAVNYCRKTQDSLQYTARGLDGKIIESYGKIGLEESSQCGMGFMLVKMEKLRSIPRPHFEVLWSEEHGEYRGEDSYFVKKIREHGMRVFIDHGISNWCQHWGSLGFNFRLWHPETHGAGPYATLKMGEGAMTEEQIHRANDGLGE